MAGNNIKIKIKGDKKLMKGLNTITKFAKKAEKDIVKFKDKVTVDQLRRENKLLMKRIDKFQKDNDDLMNAILRRKFIIERQTAQLCEMDEEIERLKIANRYLENTIARLK